MYASLVLVRRAVGLLECTVKLRKCSSVDLVMDEPSDRPSVVLQNNTHRSLLVCQRLSTAPAWSADLSRPPFSILGPSVSYALSSGSLLMLAP